MIETLKVSASSDVNKVAGAISAIVRNRKDVKISAVGAGAINQAIKAVIISKGFVAPNGIDLTVNPAFDETVINGEPRTAIALFVTSVKGGVIG